MVEYSGGETSTLCRPEVSASPSVAYSILQIGLQTLSTSYD